MKPYSETRILKAIAANDDGDWIMNPLLLLHDACFEYVEGAPTEANIREKILAWDNASSA